MIDNACLPLRQPACQIIRRPFKKICRLLLAFALAAFCYTSAAEDSADRGRALFKGVEPLTGRLRRHADNMPPFVIVCSNCHADHVSGKDASAPVLTPYYLLHAQSRRHGPPSTYSRDNFCILLRTGVDPVHIMIDPIMPIYTVSNSDCDNLWRYLVPKSKPDA